MRGKRFRFENRYQQLFSRVAFAMRMLKYIAAAMGVVLVSLFAGMLGYLFIGGMSWMNAFLNASMILFGVGPVGELKTEGMKLFAGIYALYSGLVLILTSGLLMAPLLRSSCESR